MSKELQVVNIVYTVKNHDDIFTVKILSDTYENAEWYLRKLILKQLQARGFQGHLDDAITVTNRSIMCEVDTYTDSVYEILSSKKKVEI